MLEFNVRCGDPETQVLMLRCEGDLGLWLHATAVARPAQGQLRRRASLVEGRSRRGDHGEPQVSGEQRVCPSRASARRSATRWWCFMQVPRRLLGVGDVW